MFHWTIKTKAVLTSSAFIDFWFFLCPSSHSPLVLSNQFCCPNYPYTFIHMLTTYFTHWPPHKRTFRRALVQWERNPSYCVQLRFEEVKHFSSTDSYLGSWGGHLIDPQIPIWPLVGQFHLTNIQCLSHYWWGADENSHLHLDAVVKILWPLHVSLKNLSLLYGESFSQRHHWH